MVEYQVWEKKEETKEVPVVKAPQSPAQSTSELTQQGYTWTQIPGTSKSILVKVGEEAVFTTNPQNFPTKVSITKTTLTTHVGTPVQPTNLQTPSSDWMPVTSDEEAKAARLQAFQQANLPEVSKNTWYLSLLDQEKNVVMKRSVGSGTEYMVLPRQFKSYQEYKDYSYGEEFIQKKVTEIQQDPVQRFAYAALHPITVYGVSQLEPLGIPGFTERSAIEKWVRVQHGRYSAGEPVHVVLGKAVWESETFQAGIVAPVAGAGIGALGELSAASSVAATGYSLAQVGGAIGLGITTYSIGGQVIQGDIAGALTTGTTLGLSAVGGYAGYKAGYAAMKNWLNTPLSPPKVISEDVMLQQSKEGTDVFGKAKMVQEYHLGRNVYQDIEYAASVSKLDIPRSGFISTNILLKGEYETIAAGVVDIYSTYPSQFGFQRWTYYSPQSFTDTAAGIVHRTPWIRGSAGLLGSEYAIITPTDYGITTQKFKLPEGKIIGAWTSADLYAEGVVRPDVGIVYGEKWNAPWKGWERWEFKIIPFEGSGYGTTISETKFIHEFGSPSLKEMVRAGGAISAGQTITTAPISGSFVSGLMLNPSGFSSSYASPTSLVSLGMATPQTTSMKIKAVPTITMSSKFDITQTSKIRPMSFTSVSTKMDIGQNERYRYSTGFITRQTTWQTQATATSLALTSINTTPISPSISIPSFIIPRIPFKFESGGGGGDVLQPTLSKQKRKYMPSLFGIWSGKKVYKTPKSLTGMEMRYPIGKKPKKKSGLKGLTIKIRLPKKWKG